MQNGLFSREKDSHTSRAEGKETFPKTKRYFSLQLQNLGGHVPQEPPVPHGSYVSADKSMHNFHKYTKQRWNNKSKRLKFEVFLSVHCHGFSGPEKSPFRPSDNHFILFHSIRKIHSIPELKGVCVPCFSNSRMKASKLVSSLSNHGHLISYMKGLIVKNTNTLSKV